MFDPLLAPPRDGRGALSRPCQHSPARRGRLSGVGAVSVFRAFSLVGVGNVAPRGVRDPRGGITLLAEDHCFGGFGGLSFGEAHHAEGGEQAE